MLRGMTVIDCAPRLPDATRTVKPLKFTSIDCQKRMKR